jgi:hypothetical protein
MSSRLSRLAFAASLVAAASCEPAKPPAPAAPPGPPERVVVVRAKDFSFDAPNDLEPGAVTFRFINDGPGLHHMQLIKFDSGKTLVDLQEAMKKKPGPFPKWVSFHGGSNATSAGTEESFSTNLPAGDYAIICMVDIPDHVPHFMKGMSHAFHVGVPGEPVVAAAPAKNAAPAKKAAPAVAAAPPPPPPAPAPEPARSKADVTITLRDYSFDLSDSIKAGKQTIDVYVDADQPHELQVFRLNPGVTVEEFMKWGSSYTGPLPATALGGTAAAGRGYVGRFTPDVKPGTYVFMCFLPDAKDGRPHAAHGMVMSFTVK